MNLEGYLRGRIAEAVEADDLPAQLLTDLDTAIAAMRAEPPAARREHTIQFLAEATDLSTADVEHALQGVERGGHDKKARLLVTVVDEWLEAQRQAYRQSRQP